MERQILAVAVEQVDLVVLALQAALVVLAW